MAAATSLSRIFLERQLMLLAAALPSWGCSLHLSHILSSLRGGRRDGHWLLCARQDNPDSLRDRILLFLKNRSFVFVS